MAELGIRRDDLADIGGSDNPATDNGTYIDPESGEFLEPPKREETDEEIESREQSEDEHQDEGEDGELGEDREAIRERRRQERRDRKLHQRERVAQKDRMISSLQRQLQDQAMQLAQLQGRQSRVDVGQLNAAFEDARAEFEAARFAIQQASEAGDGAKTVEATDRYYTARRKLEHIAGVKQQVAERMQARNNPPPIDPEVMNMANSWVAKNRWYDPQGTDQDSRVTLSIDQQLAQEGFDPRTREYWEELDDRVSKYLPHRAKKGYNSGGGTASTSSRSERVVTDGAGREAAATTKGKGYYLSPERVRAMKEAGVYDDPKKRAAVIKRYQEYDRQAKESE